MDKDIKDSYDILPSQLPRRLCTTDYVGYIFKMCSLLDEPNS